jgi:triacylglycerol esterase/lipase EstA (alpha/beta hydrolase family)
MMSDSRPTSRSARPAVLLVPGWSDTARRLQRCRTFLLASGWNERQVSCLSFRDRFGSNIEHADEIAGAVAELTRLAQQRQIAVIAHSMGGLALRHYLGRGGNRFVHTAIFAGTPHGGTWTAWLAWGRGGAEMRPGSTFLQRLNRERLPADVRAFCLRTPIDTRVLPGRSAWLDGAVCHTVRAPTHPRMLRHAGTLALIRDILLDTP